MKKDIMAILENLNAVLERLTQEQQNKLIEDAMQIMLDDPSIDPRTKMGIQYGQTNGFSQAHLNMAYKELSDTLQPVDPTDKRTYIDFILRLYSRGGVSFGALVNPEFKEQLAKYHDLKNRNKINPPYNDISRFKNYDEFIAFVTSQKDAPTAKQKEQAVSDNAEVFYENDQVTVIIPHDEAASCKYGKGTRWCVSALKKNEFARYNEKGDLFFFIPKNPEYDREKYAIHFASDSAWDDDDRVVEITDVLYNRFGDLTPVFLQNDEYKKWLAKTILL